MYKNPIVGEKIKKMEKQMTCPKCGQYKTIKNYYTTMIGAGGLALMIIVPVVIFLPMIFFSVFDGLSVNAIWIIEGALFFIGMIILITSMVFKKNDISCHCKNCKYNWETK